LPPACGSRLGRSRSGALPTDYPIAAFAVLRVVPVAPLAGGTAVILKHRFAHIPQDARSGRAWIAALAPTLRGPPRPGRGRARRGLPALHRLGVVLLAAGSGPAQLLERSPEQARARALDHLVLWTPLHGRARILA